MREIKFRAWTGVMYEPFEIRELFSASMTYPELKNIHASNLMQYTGLKDKNGVEIYEGDIVMVPYGKPVNENGEVAYYKILQEVPTVIKYNAPYFVPILQWGKRTIAKNIPKSRQSLWLKESSEVIGNIHENPELLNGNA